MPECRKPKFELFLELAPLESKNLSYFLRPTERGEYHFGTLNVFVESKIGLIMRRYRFREETTVAVYPSYLQMRKYELMAMSNRLNELGVKKIRKLYN